MTAHTARPHDLRVEAASFSYGTGIAVGPIDLSVRSNAITVIVGANGCGKSTLLRGMARLLTPRGGAVTLDGRSVHDIPTRALARSVGLLPQQPIAPEGITVADLVARGRFPHQGPFGRTSAEDEHAIAEALAATETVELAPRRVEELSGGQRQRVWIAMALAQRTDILLLDEPTTFLDVAHQIEVLDVLRDLNRRSGTTVVMVLHDLALAARYADDLVVLASGAVLAHGAPADVLTVETVRAAFGIDALVIDDPVTGTPLVVPIGREPRS